MTALPGPLGALAEPASQLGLLAGQVRVVDHCPAWAALYESVADHLRESLRGLDAMVEHIGSTAVPGLAAKPVLDIAVGATAPIDNERYIAAIEKAGFGFETDLGIYGGLLFTASSQPGVVISNLHVVDSADFQWRWYLLLRDGLRRDPALRAKYASLKQDAAAVHADSRDGYNKAKFDWVLATVQALDAH